MTPICIACGCDERHACEVNLIDAGDPRGCFWMRFDARLKAGVCSECADQVSAWDAGRRLPLLEVIADRYHRQVLFLYGGERSSALAWMRAPHDMLKGKAPRDLILAGEIERVRTLVDLMASGAFA